MFLSQMCARTLFFVYALMHCYYDALHRNGPKDKIRKPSVEPAAFRPSDLDGVWYLAATTELTTKFCLCNVMTYTVYTAAYRYTDTCFQVLYCVLPSRDFYHVMVEACAFSHTRVQTCTLLRFPFLPLPLLVRLFGSRICPRMARGATKRYVFNTLK